MFSRKTQKNQPKYPGKRMALDGNTAVIMCEREASDAAGAYPITPSTQMGEYWAEEAARGHRNVSGRPLVFIEPESEHAAAGVTAGMSMSGLRAANFSSAQGVAFMHESLYAAAGKRLPYVLNIGARAITKASLNVHCAHDDYHCIDDTGFIQFFAADAQGAADLNLIARKTAELSLTPAAVAQDGFLTTHLIEPVRVPERELIEEFLGHPDDEIECPTPAQKMIYGETRRRVPMLWDVDNPVTSGVVQNQDSFMQTVAAQRPFFYDHVREIAEQVMAEYAALTGREYGRITTFGMDGADYVIVGMGSMIPQARAIAEYLGRTRGLKVGVLDLTMHRPFPGDLISKALLGRKGVAVLERTDQPLAEDQPVMREVRAALTKALENAQARRGEEKPWPGYASASSARDIPPLYSGVYGLGSRDLQPEGIIAAVENMLPDGPGKRFYYLSIDFVRDIPASPREEVRQQKLLEAYPGIRDLAIRGSENPDLLPEGAITVRMHSIGGWGAITTGKNLAMTLYELLGFEIKANPKYGSEKKGQPTTYYMSAAPEPIPLTCEYHHVDVVLSPDPHVFNHSNPLHGLKKGGAFIIQHSGTARELWESLPPHAQRYIIENEIHLHFVDGFKIAREEASNPELQLRMQGNAFQGAFFAASPLMERVGLNEKKLFAAIEDQLQAKFGAKGQKVVEDNLRVVRRGFDETQEVTIKALTTGETGAGEDAGPPVLLRDIPEAGGGLADIHRFWEQTGHFYATGEGENITADPFQALSLIPASTGIFRDMTNIRFEYPEFLAEKCTACGECYTVCPDAACPGLVNTVAEVFDAAVAAAEAAIGATEFLRRETRNLEKILRPMLEEAGEEADVNALLKKAVKELLSASSLKGKELKKLRGEFRAFLDAIGDFRFSLTRPYWTNMEKRQKGAGGLFSITIDPYACKGCMECVEVCKDGALIPRLQEEKAVARLRSEWDFWRRLPTTGPQFSRIDDLDEKIGALQTLLLDKTAYNAMVCGDGACLGCGEKTAIHLFTSTVSALMQPRVKEHVKKLGDLIDRLERHIRLKLSEGVDLSDPDAVRKAAGETEDLTLSELAARLDAGGVSTVLDKEWLTWATDLLEKLRDLKWRYEEGPTRRGRAPMGVINSTGCTSVWGSTFPYNPYPFPWTSHLFQDSPSVAMGVFEGHMAKMAEGFKAIRMAELELAGKYRPAEHEEVFARFGWKDFSDEEWRLCPPVVAIGGDGAMYDIGFQNLSRAMASGMPIKVFVVDTQVYSNTGGQACTSGFISQVADMSPYGKERKGKEEIRKEISLIGMAHRTTFVLQGAQSNVTHLLEGYIDGLNSRRPALFNIYAVCPPEHGVGDDAANMQAKMAVESRAYPLVRFDPDAGETFEECLDLSGNPAPEEDWPQYELAYVDENGAEARMRLPFTFADFAATEGRFRKHFRKVPREAWNDEMTPFHEFLDMDEDEREGLFPYIWATDEKNRLIRIVCSAEIVRSAEERRGFWRQLKGLAGIGGDMDIETAVARAKSEMAGKLASALLGLADGGGAQLLSAAGAAPEAPAAAPAPAEQAADTGGEAPPEAPGYEPVWIETPDCTSCDECVLLAPGIFRYNEDNQAVVANPRGGTFEDIVKAAEKCTAGCIHPGTPWDMSEKNIEKLIKRAEKYQ